MRRSIASPATFPLLGPALDGRWQGFRLILGPWPWTLIVHVYDEEADLVIVVTIQDARAANAPRSIQWTRRDRSRAVDEVDIDATTGCAYPLTGRDREWIVRPWSTNAR